MLRSEVGRQTGVRLHADADVHRRRRPRERRTHRGPARARPASRTPRSPPPPRRRTPATPTRTARRGRRTEDDRRGRRADGSTRRTDRRAPRRAGRPDRPDDGLLVVDKPAGLDVPRRRRPRPPARGTRRVGHAGTLDPMATGVLVLGVGRATGCSVTSRRPTRSTTATIRLGVSTVTDDAEGEVVRRPRPSTSRRRGRRAAVAALDRRHQQVPSAVSAPSRSTGERAYHRVRAGEDVELAARPVTVRASTSSTCAGRTEACRRRRRGGRRAPPAPTSAPSPATSAPPSASAATSPRCGAPASARTTSPRAHSTTSRTVQLLAVADAAAAAFARVDVDAETAARLAHGAPMPPTGARPVAASVRARLPRSRRGPWPTGQAHCRVRRGSGRWLRTAPEWPVFMTRRPGIVNAQVRDRAQQGRRAGVALNACAHMSACLVARPRTRTDST